MPRCFLSGISNEDNETLLNQFVFILSEPGAVNQGHF